MKQPHVTCDKLHCQTGNHGTAQLQSDVSMVMKVAIMWQLMMDDRKIDTMKMVMVQIIVNKPVW